MPVVWSDILILSLQTDDRRFPRLTCPTTHTHAPHTLCHYGTRALHVPLHFPSFAACLYMLDLSVFLLVLMAENIVRRRRWMVVTYYIFMMDLSTYSHLEQGGRMIDPDAASSCHLSARRKDNGAPRARMARWRATRAAWRHGAPRGARCAAHCVARGIKLCRHAPPASATIARTRARHNALSRRSPRALHAARCTALAHARGVPRTPRTHLRAAAHA